VDGQKRAVALGGAHVTPILVGEPVGRNAGVTLDVTERKIAEHRLVKVVKTRDILRAIPT
jgi:hypothetical protein